MHKRHAQPAGRHTLRTQPATPPYAPPPTPQPFLTLAPTLTRKSSSSISHSSESTDTRVGMCWPLACGDTRGRRLPGGGGGCCGRGPPPAPGALSPAPGGVLHRKSAAHVGGGTQKATPSKLLLGGGCDTPRCGRPAQARVLRLPSAWALQAGRAGPGGQVLAHTAVAPQLLAARQGAVLTATSQPAACFGMPAKIRVLGTLLETRVEGLRLVIACACRLWQMRPIRERSRLALHPASIPSPGDLRLLLDPSSYPRASPVVKAPLPPPRLCPIRNCPIWPALARPSSPAPWRRR